MYIYSRLLSAKLYLVKVDYHVMIPNYDSTFYFHIFNFRLITSHVYSSDAENKRISHMYSDIYKDKNSTYQVFKKHCAIYLRI